MLPRVSVSRSHTHQVSLETHNLAAAPRRGLGLEGEEVAPHGLRAHRAPSPAVYATMAAASEARLGQWPCRLTRSPDPSSGQVSKNGSFTQGIWTQTLRHTGPIDALNAKAKAH